MTNVIEARRRLDKTLSSPALSDTATLCNLVRKQLQKSYSGTAPADQVVENKSKQLYTLLESLRSARGERTTKVVDGEWNVKQDTPRFRVMYREGPEGTPYHSLCLDGIIDGPMSSALVVSWEVPMYKDWWPQFVAPPFKIVESRWLQRATVAGDLSLLRCKVPWPLAMREVLLSSFELDYFDEDLLVVLYSSAPDEPDEKIDGISRDQVPKLEPNVVRMDLLGGFVYKKVSPDCVFFRLVVDLDMKLDLVPPWFINFIARQLAGHGYKLYQKAVTGVKNSPFEKLVNTEPMYKRIQAALECTSPNLYEPMLLPMMPSEKDMPVFYKEPFKEGELEGLETAFKSLSDRDLSVKQVSDHDTSEKTKPTEAPVQDRNTFTDRMADHVAQPPIKLDSARNGAIPTSRSNGSKVIMLSPELEEEELRPDVDADRASSDPEVVWALQVLNKLIAHFNKQKASAQTNGNRGTRIVTNSNSTSRELLSSTGNIDLLSEMQVSSDQGQESSLRTLEHIVYSAGQSRSTAALGKVMEEETLANGSHGIDKRQTGNEPLAAAAESNHAESNGGNGKVFEGKLKAAEADARGHAPQKVHRFFQPFRLRKRRKDGKP